MGGRLLAALLNGVDCHNYNQGDDQKAQEKFHRIYPFSTLKV